MSAAPAATAPDQDVAVAVVGAGPRGTSVLERLCASAAELLPPCARLTVHVVDPSPPGPGRVWRTAQPSELLMNTVASQVTLFTDESVDCAGPVLRGPSLHEWAAAGHAPGLGPDDYPTRACYGRYLEWVFAETLRGAPGRVRVEVHAARAVRLDGDPAGSSGGEDPGDGAQLLVLEDGRKIRGLGAVVLAQGHLPTVDGQDGLLLAEHAARHGLRHIAPANPADVDLSAIAPGERVLLRGLGLNFFDHMALLTQGRGGRFMTAPSGGLRYRPSGHEPKLYAGSRRGIPYQARGDNAKGAYGRHDPAVLTPDVIARFRKRADSGGAPDFLDEIWPLVAKEVETVYYAALVRPAGRSSAFRAAFLDVPHRSPQEALILDEFGITEAARWSWDRLARPCADRAFRSPDDFRGWLLTYLREDTAQAALGNVASPLKSALDVLRDLRNELRLIVDHGGIAGPSRRTHLDRWYTPLNAFLSIGPPRRRIEEMTALIEAGVLDVLGPRLDVRAGADGTFHAHSPDVPGSDVRVTTLIEARLPEPDVRRTADELLGRLVRTGQCRPHVVDGYETGGLDVTPRPYRLIDRQGRAHTRRFAFGVPTEGVHWVTAAGARPGVDSVTLSDADAVARAVLRTAATAPAVKAVAEAESPEWPDVELASID
ncbi:FAD/NAD(P)-binding protein [Streptomyces sp. NBC_01381]|uniref:FAD/NAD(P)-binding protein n=1 Tax=Streptomyces sp. NBC_01381 TaxID=2903845 RepID=UPI0022542528|nr:FAD/NAD(P)-binding protein [Streptomyces sp. NBC_01381]MCX4667522.1 FAD/NAD(P)-binding protein [Streptomyces sp. NBC_01381]